MLFYGEVDKEEAFRYSEELNKNPEMTFTESALVVIKHSNLVYSIEDAEAFAEEMAHNRSIVFRSKIAVLVENPLNTVAATIYAQTLMKLRKGLKIKLFYTLEAALIFLNKECYSSRIQQIISDTGNVEDVMY